MRVLISVLMAAGIVATSKSDVIIVSDPATVAACERLGEVTSSSMMGGVLTGTGYKRALEKLKERATELGGTHLHLLNGNSNYAGSNFLGVAYRCPATTSPRSPSDRP